MSRGDWASNRRQKRITSHLRKVIRMNRSAWWRFGLAAFRVCVAARSVAPTAPPPGRILRRVLTFGVVVLTVSAVAGLSAQSPPEFRIESIRIVHGGSLEFTFRDRGTGATLYFVQYSPDLGVKDPWTHDTSAVITPLGQGEHRVVIPHPTGPRGFYRVVGIGPSGDVVAEFTTTAFHISEGETISPTITFSAPFTGTLRYTISGTATPDDYAALSGEIEVFNSTTATVPITLADNETIDTLRVLILTLEADDGARPGLSSRVVITIEDRDARWEGTFSTGRTALPFSLEIIRTGAATNGYLVGGASHFFPEGPFPAIITMDTATAFAAAMGGIPLPADSTLLNIPASLSLSLTAVQGEDGHEVREHLITGDATFVTTYSGHPHLTTTNTGTFRMQRVPPPPSEREVELNATP